MHLPRPRSILASAALLACVLSTSASHAQQTPADTLFAEGHYLRAQPLILSNLQKNPTDIHAIVKASELQWAFFHEDASIALAEKAVALNSNSPEAHVQLTNALGTRLIDPSTSTMEKMSLARRFHKEAELAVQLSPNHPDAVEDLANFYWNAPGFVGGDKSKAHQFADRLSQIDPARGAALKASFLADDKDKAHRLAATEALWRQAVAATPQTPTQSYDSHIGLAAVAFEEGGDKLALAESESRRAIAIDPTRIAAYRQLAILYATTGRWDDLDAILKRAHAAVPDNLSPQYQAAHVILTQNATAQLNRAEQYLRAYLAQPAEGREPPHPAARWRLGLVLEKQGHKADAVHEIQTAVNQDSSLEAAKKDLKRLQ